MTKSRKSERSEDWEGLLEIFSGEKDQNDSGDESYLVACIMMLTSQTKSSDIIIFDAFTKSRFADKLHDFLHRLIRSCLEDDEDRKMSEVYLRLALQCLSVIYAQAKNYEKTLYVWADCHASALCALLENESILSNQCNLDIKRILPTLLLYRLSNFKEGNRDEKNWVTRFSEWIMIERLVPFMNETNDDNGINMERNNDNDKNETEKNCNNDEDAQTLCRLLKSLLKPSSGHENEKIDSESMSYWINCFHLSILLQIPSLPSDERKGQKMISCSKRTIFYQSCRKYFDAKASISPSKIKEKEELWIICMFLILQIFDPTRSDSKDDLEDEINFVMEMCVMGMTWQSNDVSNSRKDENKKLVENEGNTNPTNIRQITIHIMAELLERYGTEWMLRENKYIKKLPKVPEKSQSLGLSMTFCTLLRLVVGEIRIVMGSSIIHMSNDDNENGDHDNKFSSILKPSSSTNAIIVHGIRFALVALQTMSKLAMNETISDSKIWSFPAIRHVQQSLSDLAHSSQEYINLFGQKKVESNFGNFNMAQMQCVSFLGAFYSQVDLEWNTNNEEQESMKQQSSSSKIKPILLAIKQSIFILQQSYIGMADKNNKHNGAKKGLDTVEDNSDLNGSRKGTQNRNISMNQGHQTILCLIPCIVSIMSQCIDQFPNSLYYEEDFGDDDNNIPHIIYMNFFQSTNLMESILVDYMTNDVMEKLILCKEGTKDDSAVIIILSNLSWCFLLVDTWCQFVTHFRKNIRFSKVSKGEEDVIVICNKLLTNGIIPCLETLILQYDKNEHIFPDPNALYEFAQTAITLFECYNDMRKNVPGRDDFSIPNLHQTENKCHQLASQAFQLCNTHY